MVIRDFSSIWIWLGGNSSVSYAISANMILFAFSANLFVEKFSFCCGVCTPVTLAFRMYAYDYGHWLLPVPIRWVWTRLRWRWVESIGLLCLRWLWLWFCKHQCSNCSHTETNGDNQSSNYEQTIWQDGRLPKVDVSHSRVQVHQGLRRPRLCSHLRLGRQVPARSFHHGGMAGQRRGWVRRHPRHSQALAQQRGDCICGG